MSRILMVVPLLAIGCGGGGLRYDLPKVDPANFVSGIDNPYMTLIPGMVLSYEEIDDGEREKVEITVTSQTRVVMGVTCMVVKDIHSDASGKVIEDTDDWFAQDKQGNVWYFGEDTTEFTSAGPNKKGSWEGGVNGALPGIVMKAAPKLGERYYQEYLLGEAEDEAEVLSVTEKVTVPHGTYENCIKTRDWTKLEPNVIEHKTYCSGVGMVLAEGVQGSNSREQLLNVKRP